MATKVSANRLLIPAEIVLRHRYYPDLFTRIGIHHCNISKKATYSRTVVELIEASLDHAEAARRGPGRSKLKGWI